MLLAISQLLHLSSTCSSVLDTMSRPTCCWLYRKSFIMLSNLWFFLSTRLFAINACSPFHIPILHTHLMHHTLRRTLYNPASYLQDVLRVSTSLQPQLTGHNSPSFYNRLLLSNDFSRFLPFSTSSLSPILSTDVCDDGHYVTVSIPHLKAVSRPCQTHHLL